jgi:hypothetical protein
VLKERLPEDPDERLETIFGAVSFPVKSAPDAMRILLR